MGRLWGCRANSMASQVPTFHGESCPPSREPVLFFAGQGNKVGGENTLLRRNVLTCCSTPLEIQGERPNRDQQRKKRVLSLLVITDPASIIPRIPTKQNMHEMDGGKRRRRQHSPIRCDLGRRAFRESMRALVAQRIAPLFLSHPANNLILHGPPHLIYGNPQFGEDRLHALPKHTIHCVTYLALQPVFRIGAIPCYVRPPRENDARTNGENAMGQIHCTARVCSRRSVSWVPQQCLSSGQAP